MYFLYKSIITMENVQIKVILWLSCIFFFDHLNKSKVIVSKSCLLMLEFYLFSTAEIYLFIYAFQSHFIL